MFRAEIIGAREVIGKMENIAAAIKPAIRTGMQVAGEQILTELRNEFPDMKFSSQFFPESFELWFIADGIIICKVGGKRITNIESQLGVRSQRKGKDRGIQSAGKATFVKQFNLKQIAEEKGSIVSQRIKEIILGVLK